MQREKVVSMLGKDCFIVVPTSDSEKHLHGNFYIGRLEKHEKDFWLTVEDFNDGNPFKVDVGDIAAMLPMQSLYMFTGRKTL